ncbi:heterokaryon incompatibility protein-domain-containing protein [Podospora fimiseda]|uniref:Heterokaryon incompatibility protein-domain-containing protein n=1 Tax=Podospora fimiseda TaxID=252190 RepID=A0AAN6YTR5_9PEZI|nr:heterokaryon incompatibility protein-domain-containing protein [Podospora fimiseda]
MSDHVESPGENPKLSECKICDAISDAFTDPDFEFLVGLLGEWKDVVTSSPCTFHPALILSCDALESMPENDRVNSTLYIGTASGTTHVSLAIVAPDGCSNEMSLQALHVPDGPLLNPDLGRGRLVDEHWVDIDLLREWEQKCRKEHGMTCGGPHDDHSNHLSSMQPVWLIDVWQRCLVKASVAPEYTALSYVWGGFRPFTTLLSNIHQLQVPFSLDSGPNIPRTVSDAIMLTQNLGIRYLWVDALCIVQDDEDHRNSQIASMAGIFANASLTIVIASGVHSNTGLPGLPGTCTETSRSVQQEVFRLCNGLQGLKLQRPREYLWRPSQPWGRRVWTIQEDLFAKRRLVYMDGWFHWQCSKSTWQEDSTSSQGLTSDDLEFGVWDDLRDIRRELGPGKAPNIWALVDCFRQFVRAEITYAEDILDAFAGAATAIALSYPGGFISGLPMSLFYLSVLWDGYGELKRRRATRVENQVKLPTWSWAGWSGDIYMPLNAMRSATGTFQEAKEVITPILEWRYHLSLEDPGVPIPHYNFKENPNPSYFSISAISQIVAPYISCSTRRAYLQSEDVLSGFDKPTIITMRDSQGTFAGVLYPHSSDDIPSDPAALYEVVEVAAAKMAWSEQSRRFYSNRIVNPPTDGDEPFEFFYILWIEWEGGVAYRKGNGQVVKCQWESLSLEKIHLMMG